MADQKITEKQEKQLTGKESDDKSMLLEQRRQIAELNATVAKLQETTGRLPGADNGPFRYRVSVTSGPQMEHYEPLVINTNDICSAQVKFIERHGIPDVWRYRFNVESLDRDKVKEADQAAKLERYERMGIKPISPLPQPTL